MVLERCIEANLEKVEAILCMDPPQNINEVQKLVGQIVAFNRFIFRSTNKCLAFFKVLHKTLVWDN